MQRKTYFFELGIIFSVIFLIVFIVLVYINFTSPYYFCEPRGAARIASWLYLLKFWITPNYSPCGLLLKDATISGFIWLIIGFGIGSAFGKCFKKKII